MSAKQLFEYAVVRVVPQVEREEFINVGVILYCATERYLQIRYNIDEGRIKAFSAKVSIDEVRAILGAFESICKGGADAGPIGAYSTAERFRWLTASRSTVVQTSCVHPGLCDNAERKLQKLYEEMVL